MPIGQQRLLAIASRVSRAPIGASAQIDGYAAVKVNAVDRRRLDDGEEVKSASATERRSDTFGVDSWNRRSLTTAVDQRSRVTPTRV